jgi:aspartyl-tRNA(Asn)/glutamyl-tRNA(Gln) amidotransferase subunit A
LKERPQDFGEDIRLKLEMGELPSAVDYLQAQQMRRQIKLDFENAFKKVDVIISPTFPFTGSVNLTGLPAITVPCGFLNGMLVGIQRLEELSKRIQYYIWPVHLKK